MHRFGRSLETAKLECSLIAAMTEDLESADGNTIEVRRLARGIRLHLANIYREVDGVDEGLEFNRVRLGIHVSTPQSAQLEEVGES